MILGEWERFRVRRRGFFEFGDIVLSVFKGGYWYVWGKCGRKKILRDAYFLCEILSREGIWFGLGSDEI